MSAEGERRLEKFLAGLRNASTDAKDYETLGRSEPADPDWSPRLEALIQRTIDRHAGEFGQLEIGRPRGGIGGKCIAQPVVLRLPIGDHARRFQVLG